MTEFRSLPAFRKRRRIPGTPQNDSLYRGLGSSGRARSELKSLGDNAATRIKQQVFDGRHFTDRENTHAVEARIAARLARKQREGRAS